jgi:hypothetical protein
MFLRMVGIIAVVGLAGSAMGEIIYTPIEFQTPNMIGLSVADINDSGVVAGTLFTYQDEGPSVAHPLTWQTGQFRFPVMPDSQWGWWSTGIDNDGRLTGFREIDPLNKEGFRLSQGKLETLPFPPSRAASDGTVRNLDGYTADGDDQTTTSSVNIQGNWTGIRLRDGTITGYVVRDGVLSNLRAPGVAITWPNDIADDGLIVGQVVHWDGSWTGFILDGDEWFGVDIPIYGANNHNQLVGSPELIGEPVLIEYDSLEDFPKLTGIIPEPFVGLGWLLVGVITMRIRSVRRSVPAAGRTIRL